MNLTQKKDPAKAAAPIRKLIAAAADDLLDRICIKQYIDDISKY